MSTVAELKHTPRTFARTLLAQFLTQGFEPDRLHEWKDTGGRAIFWVAGCKHPDGRKEIRPFHATGEGFRAGKPEKPAEGWPLYGIASVHKHPDGCVFVVEGEPCADALHKLGLAAVTSGGAASCNSADWRPLAGRECVVWPDNDDAGRKYAADVAGALAPLGCNLRVLDVDALGLAPKGDCVDWLREHAGATAADVLALPMGVHEGAPKAPKAPSVGYGQLGGKLVSRRFSEVQPVRLEWLWPGRIPLGKLTLFAGDPGLGKSLVTVALAAHVSTGKPWPLCSEGFGPASVALMNAEDAADDTVRPRLDAAGADVSRVHVLDGVATESGLAPFTLESVDLLDAWLAENPDVRLVGIDPVSAFMGGTDSHVNAAVRQALAPLSEVAQRRRVAVVVVSHLNKGAGQAAYRVSGSLAFTAAARAVWLVTKDADDDQRRLVLPLKANLSPDASGLAYRVAGADNGAAHLVWDRAPVTVTAQEALAPVVDDGERTATSEAMDFLRDALAQGPRAAGDVQREARAAGASDKCLRTAKKRLGVVARKADFAGGWRWCLPEHAPKEPEHAHHTEEGALGTLGAPSTGDVFEEGFL
jgi:putative DNA primase/helicase